MDSIQWGLKISMNSTVLCTTVILKRMCLFDIYIYIYIYIYIAVVLFSGALLITSTKRLV